MLPEILTDCKTLTEKITKEKEKLSRLKDYLKVVTQELSDMPRGNSKESRIEKLTAQIIDTENRIIELELQREDRRATLIERLERTVRTAAGRSILWLRYGLCKSFGVIGRELKYSDRQVYRVHRAALHDMDGR